LNIVVCGWVAAFPVAGFFWHPVAYALGFRELGHDVWFLDDGGWTTSGFDPETGADDPECSAGVRFLEREMAAVGLDGRWVHRHMGSDRFSGLDEATTMDVLADADVLVNVSLMLPSRPEYQRIPHRLAIDTDPVFTQVSVARGSPIPEMHTRLFTFGRPPLPGQQHEWVPTRQAVATRHWPVAPPPTDVRPFTTVTSWQAYAPLEWEGREYGLKDRSVREHIDLPRRTRAPLSIGMAGGIDGGEGARFLQANGWQIEDGLAPTRTCDAYRRYIAGSAGEIGFAKHAYVAARSGWFSDRTCCYLASGRPAVVQDTGWTDWLPSGEGVFGFTTTEEAAAALEEVSADLPRHCAAARKVAEEHFDAATVCAELLERGL
jgi:hypothetical protein